VVNVENFDWALNFYKQACFDWLHAQALADNVQLPFGKALSLAQFQQAAEKAMKASVLWETRKKLGRDEPIVLSHRIWQDALGERHLATLRDRFLEAIAPWTEEKIAELENFAPHGTIDLPNTEYPWQKLGDVFIPAEHFATKPGKEILGEMRGIAGAIILSVKDYNSPFTEVFEAARLAFDLKQGVGKSGETES
jgi:hypothetical protein